MERGRVENEKQCELHNVAELNWTVERSELQHAISGLEQESRLSVANAEAAQAARAEAERLNAMQLKELDMYRSEVQRVGYYYTSEHYARFSG